MGFIGFSDEKETGGDAGDTDKTCNNHQNVSHIASYGDGKNRRKNHYVCAGARGAVPVSSAVHSIAAGPATLYPPQENPTPPSAQWGGTP